MSRTKNPQRRTFRAAAQIHERLTRPSSFIRWTDLPAEAWNEAARIAERLRYGLARGWCAAGRYLLEDLAYTLRQLQRELELFQRELPSSLSAEHVVPCREIAADLMALEREFDEVCLDLAESSVSVLTDPIELEGVALGRFRIVLSWKQLGQTRPYEVIAEQPSPAAENEEITHPHLQGGQLCEGEGAASIRAALREGRILDFFTIVVQILNTYNAASAHVSLDRWLGVRCRACGYIMSLGDEELCERCGDTVCHDCTASCQACACTLCVDCSSECAECSDTFCGNCVATRDSTGQLVCNACLEQQQEQAHDANNSPPADSTSARPDSEAVSLHAPSTADPLCLGQADFST